MDTVDVNLRQNVQGFVMTTLRVVATLFVVSVSMPVFLVVDVVVMVTYVTFQVVSGERVMHNLDLTTSFDHISWF